MPISIITPFLNHPELIPDYASAVKGAEVIIIDNASDETTAHAITEHLAPNVYVRNNTNAGFAAANNQGYARATGDVIVFLNSDIAADPRWLACVAYDVKDGALYGPALQYQMVAGKPLPYLEGWCIAATRGTWERLCPHADRLLGWSVHQIGVSVPIGPWDDVSYPGPYWEDNDLCLRAAGLGIGLVHTKWGMDGLIRHKGGQSAGPIVNHRESFERNRATFAARALATINAPTWTPMYQRYMQAVYMPSDIQHHLPYLYSKAKGNVVELGTRGGVSTVALVAGVEKRGGHVWSIDTADCSAVAAGHAQWTFLQYDSRDADVPIMVDTPIDLLLIDTEHVIEIAEAELALWSSYMRPGGAICMHDPETFPGVRRAATDFCAARGWALTFVLPCNGMAIIEVPE